MYKMKDSGVELVGKIPQDKKILKNKYYISYFKGKKAVNINNEGIGNAYIGASDLDDDSHNYENFSTDTGLLTCKEDDILILWDGARAGLAGTNHNGIVSSTICKLLLNDKIFFPKFFYWYLRGFENHLINYAHGTTIPHMNKKYIEDIHFINWTIEEQKKISAYLDRKCTEIEKIIALKKQQIELIKEYKKNLITETVLKGLNKNVSMKDSGVEWVGKIPEHWEVKKLKYSCNKRNEKYKSSEGKLDYFSLENIVSWDSKYIETENIYELDGTNLCYKGDVVFGKLRPYLAKTFLVDYDRCCSSEFAVFCNFQGVAKYYLYLFTEQCFINIVDNSTYGVRMPRANIKFIENIFIPVPPTEEQEAIVNYLDGKCKTIDKIIDLKNQQIDLLKEYKKSLIYEVVTGKKEIFQEG